VNTKVKGKKQKKETKTEKKHDTKIQVGVDWE